MDEREAIFRRVVVERLSSPDQLDQLLQVLRPRSWMLLMAIGLLVGTALVWGTSGTVAVTVPASGLLLRAEGIMDSRSPCRGRVVELPSVDDVFGAGTPIATLDVAPTPGEKGLSGGGASVDVTLPFATRVVEVLAHVGQEVEAGMPLLSVERTDQELRAVLFVSGELANQIQPGMAAWISVQGSGDGPGESVEGKVLQVASRPATLRGLKALLADPALSERLMSAGRRWRVKVLLPSEKSGGDQPLVPRVSRTVVDARIVLREEHPIERLLPWIRARGS